MLWLAALVAAAFVSSSMGQGPPGGSPPGLDKAIAAKEKNAQRMLDKPGVVGIGVGLNHGGKPVIEIYKEQPNVADLPDELEGVPVESITTGRIEPRSLRPTASRDLRRSASRLVWPASPRAPWEYASPTGHDVYVLSNNHVLAGVNTASIGDPIIQPGDVDGGDDPGDRIATLAEFQMIDFKGGTRTMDAAIALTTTRTSALERPPRIRSS